VVISLERGADLHTAQLMPLPLTVCGSSKIQIGFTFLVPAHLGSPGKRAVKWVCNWVCVFILLLQIQRMVISGGNFSPDILKPKEVVSLLLDDDEMERKRE